MSQSIPVKSSLANPSIAVGIQEQQSADDFLVQRCGFCGMKMALDAGDVTFGGEWYHPACWRLAKEKLREHRDE